MLLILSGCGLVGNDGSRTLPTADLFKRAPGDRPVLIAGKADRPIMVADPGIYADDAGLHLFFSSLFCRKDGAWYYSWDPAHPTACASTGWVGGIAYAFSDDDGLTWTFRETPIIVPDTEGWQTSIETAFPVRIGDTLYVLYSAHGHLDGQPLTNRYQIGVAGLDVGDAALRETLLDPANVLAKRPEPLLPYDLDRTTRTNNTQEPSVVVRDGRVELYFIGLGFTKPRAGVNARGQEIASIDFMRALFDTQLRPLGKPQRLDIDPPINITEVRWHEGRYHVFFTTLEGDDSVFHKDERIGHATSTDGLTWRDAAVVLEPGPPGTFDDWGIMAPTVTFRDGEAIMFYSAFQRLDRKPYPVPADGRVGVPVESDPNVTILANVGRAVATGL